MSNDKSHFQELLENAGYKCQTYSGRGQYGKYCLAVITDHSIGQFIANIIESLEYIDERNLEETIDEAEEIFPSMKTDNMGKDKIVIYFPNAEYVDDEENEDDSPLSEYEEEEDIFQA